VRKVTHALYTNFNVFDQLSLHEVRKWLSICEKFDYHHGSELKLRNTCRRSLT